jgi:hypothetical protein
MHAAFLRDPLSPAVRVAWRLSCIVLLASITYKFQLAAAGSGCALNSLLPLVGQRGLHASAAHFAIIAILMAVTGVFGKRTNALYKP